VCSLWWMQRMLLRAAGAPMFPASSAHGAHQCLVHLPAVTVTYPEGVLAVPRDTGFVALHCLWGATGWAGSSSTPQGVVTEGRPAWCNCS